MLEEYSSLELAQVQLYSPSPSPHPHTRRHMHSRWRPSKRGPRGTYLPPLVDDLVSERIQRQREGLEGRERVCSCRVWNMSCVLSGAVQGAAGARWGPCRRVRVSN